MNVTGWNYLLEGRMIMASRIMLESYWGDWYITLLFIAFKIVLYFGTKSVLLGFVISLLFLSTLGSFLEPQALGIMIVITVFELGVLLYNSLWKK